MSVSLSCSQAFLFPLLIAGSSEIASVGGWWLSPSICGSAAWTGSSVPVILVVAQCVGCVFLWSNTGKSNWEMKNFSAQWCSYPEKQKQRRGWGWWSLCCQWLWVRAGSHTVQQTAWGGLVTLWASTEPSCPWECSVGSACVMSQREELVCEGCTLVPWFGREEEN